MCLCGTRGCRLSPFGILEQMEGHALQLSCLALHRVWGAVLGGFTWHGFFHAGLGRGREDGVKLHVDHVIPVSRGGKSVMDNLQTLCEDCNCGKGNKYVE